MVLLPVFLVYLILLDVLFMINTAVLRPIVYIIKIATCNKVDLMKLTMFVNNMYSVFFDMDTMEVEGFRRLRTISQLTFESLPQIILQIRVINYYKSVYPEKLIDLEKSGININGIIASLMTALLHTIIEMVYLNVESKACKTTLTQYSIVCFNGRFGWVPYANNFTSSEQTKQISNEVLSYDNINSKLCGIPLSVEFEFCEATFDNFLKALSALPIESSQENRVTIALGPSFLSVGFKKIVNLLQIGYQRVNIQTEFLDIT